MLDQNLLDKQFILESLIDLLEKSSNGFNQQQLSQQQQQPVAQQQKVLSNQIGSSAMSQTNSSLFEYSTSKLILVTSKNRFKLGH